MIQCFIHHLSVTDTFYHPKINNKRASRKHRPVVLFQPLDIQDLSLDLNCSYLRDIKDNRNTKNTFIGQKAHEVNKQKQKEPPVQHNLNLIMKGHQTQIEKHSTKWWNSILPNVSVMKDKERLELF